MRRALIACIHGNLVALEAVLKDIALESVDEIVCLGDMVGFGPDVIECVDLVRERCAWSLRGDHDLRLSNDPENANRALLKSLARERRLLLPLPSSTAELRERWAWLVNLSPRKSEHNALFVHGSPRDPQFEFLLAEDFLLVGVTASIKAEMAFVFDEPVCFCAHTGHPGIVSSGAVWKKPSDLENSRALIKSAEKTIVNVGAVGQPRDGDPRSCYVVWDDVEHTITFHRVPYDLVATKKRFDRAPELGAHFFDRLERGT